MRKNTARLLQLALLIILSVTISNSIGQLNSAKTYCVGYPCTSSGQCGSSCFCSVRAGMCIGSILD
jgi:hypothetical protein